MDKTVKKVIATLLKNAEITASWGIANIRIYHNSLTFFVDAMKYRGDVVIKATEHGLCVVFEDGVVLKCIYDALISVIDAKIEYSANYVEEIKAWIQTREVLFPDEGI